MVYANPISIMVSVTVSIMVWHIQWGLVILLYFSLSGVKIHEPPCKSCKYTKESILMGHTLWYGAGKELASNLTAAWCRDSNTMAGIPCFVQKLPGLTHCTLTSDDNRTLPSREVPGRSRDGTGKDLETLKVPWSRD